MTLLQFLNRFPPRLCRMSARVGPAQNQRLKTIRQISEEAGISYRKGKRIMRLNQWDGIKIEEVERIALACGVDLLRTASHIRWLKHQGRACLRSPTFVRWMKLHAGSL